MGSHPILASFDILNLVYKESVHSVILNSNVKSLLCCWIKNGSVTYNFLRIEGIWILGWIVILLIVILALAHAQQTQTAGSE